MTGGLIDDDEFEDEKWFDGSIFGKLLITFSINNSF